MPGPNNFRLQARYVFLTYPQCDIDKQDALDHFTTLLPRLPEFVLVGHERHVDGGNHLHVFLDFGSRLTTRRADYFDIGWIDDNGNDRVYHPNIQAAKQPRSALLYCKKDGDWVAAGEDPDFSQGQRDSGAAALWAGILDEATDRASFLQLVRERAPDKLVLNYGQVEAYADRHFNADTTAYQPQYTDFNVPAEVQTWVDEEFNPQVCSTWTQAAITSFLIREVLPPPSRGGRFSNE